MCTGRAVREHSHDHAPESGAVAWGEISLTAYSLRSRPQSKMQAGFLAAEYAGRFNVFELVEDEEREGAKEK